MAFGAPHARFRTARAAFRAAALARTTPGTAFESATVTFAKFARLLRRLAGHVQSLASRTFCLSSDADCLTRNLSRLPWRPAALSTSIDELRWGERQRSRRVLRQSRRVVASSDGLRDASRRESSCTDAVQPTCDPLRASSDVIRLTGRGAHARSHAVRRPLRRRLARVGDILLRSRGESVASCRRRATHAGFGAVAATSVKPHQ
jgi:hypothetical protein